MADETEEITEAKQEPGTDEEMESDPVGGESLEPAIDPAIAKPVLESLLFASPDPLSIKQLAPLMPGMNTKALRRLVLDLQIEYDQQGRGFQIIELAGGYQLATRQQFAPYIVRLNKNKKRTPLSTPALETLAIIAYKQPIVRAEIEAIRGVDSSGVIHSLLDLNLIKVTGRKEVIGRPPLYGTTEEFLKVFGLRRLNDLPSIRELREQYEKKMED